MASVPFRIGAFLLFRHVAQGNMQSRNAAKGVPYSDFMSPAEFRGQSESRLQVRNANRTAVFGHHLFDGGMIRVF